ncbi:MAG: class C sortase [Lachnospiraceae bacterium]|nr:class C sortase [Lachnospiraceae bacterium]
MSERESGRFAFVICLLLAASAACFIYPMFFQTLTRLRQVTELSGYESSFGAMERASVEAEMAAAREYNQGIAEEQEWTAFAYRGEDATDPVYEATLGLGTGGIMGDLAIPAIGISLPIAHGTREEDLLDRCGHKYGTSLPVGGESTHCVIAGHTGLPTAELFTHLTELKEGDTFFIRVLGETHRYEIESVRVVYPEEESAYLGIEKGRDLVTLYTCTPYGINDRRLLVRGRRVLPDPESGGTTGESMRIGGSGAMLVVRAALLGLLPVVILLTGTVCLVRKNRGGDWT